MKKLTLLLISSLLCVTMYSQSSVKVSLPKLKTNVVLAVPKGQIFYLDAPKDEGTETTNKAIYKGKNYPVYATKNGKLFIKLVSEKTNKAYRKYIKNTEI